MVGRHRNRLHGGGRQSDRRGSGILSLARAVLQRAAYDVMLIGDDLNAHLVRLDAALWFRGEDAGSPLSCESVCSLWRLDMNAVLARCLTGMAPTDVLCREALSLVRRAWWTNASVRYWLRARDTDLPPFPLVCRLAGTTPKAARATIWSHGASPLATKAWAWAQCQPAAWRVTDLAAHCGGRSPADVYHLIRAWRECGWIRFDPQSRQYTTPLRTPQPWSPA